MEIACDCDCNSKSRLRLDEDDKVVYTCIWNTLVICME